MKRTLNKTVATYGRYVRQGGPGRYAKIEVRGEPVVLEDKQLELVDESGLQADYLQAVREGMGEVLVDYPDISLRVIITKSHVHDVDSNAFSFNRAGQYAMRSLLFGVYVK